MTPPKVAATTLGQVGRFPKRGAGSAVVGLVVRQDREAAERDEDEAEQQGDAEQAAFIIDDAARHAGAGDAGRNRNFQRAWTGRIWT